MPLMTNPLAGPGSGVTGAGVVSWDVVAAGVSSVFSLPKKSPINPNPNPAPNPALPMPVPLDELSDPSGSLLFCANS